MQGACLTPDQTMLVTEYMEGGNLSSNIAAGRVGWYRRGKKVCWLRLFTARERGAGAAAASWMLRRCVPAALPP